MRSSSDDASCSPPSASDVADYVQALFYVYTLLIIAYILSSLFFAFGGRLPYARWSSAVLGFLRDVCEPYLSIFRRFIPPIGAARPQPDRGDPRAEHRRRSVLHNLIAG